MTVALDHLVVAARTLADGVAWCEATLGITPGPGGRHALFGTHNRLFSIASDRWPATYFEIIAIDPEAPPPARPRWFSLDDPTMQRRIEHEPQLIHWVARTPRVHRLCEALAADGFDAGRPLTASRETPAGLLQWQIVVRDDGALLHGGAWPTLIEWGAVHPTQAMPASGVMLERLQLAPLPRPAGTVLSVGAPIEVRGSTVGSAITATLQTPKGWVTLESA